MTFDPEYVAKYGHPFKGWDDPRPTKKCLHCKGTGMADAHNECGFCYRCDCTDTRQCELCDAMLADMPKPQHVYMLHGYAYRDRSELVCMMFEQREHAEEFADALPGNYRIATFGGIDYDAAYWVNVDDEVGEP